ncbi:MAG: S-layer family protein, partial [Leptolyngbyaceae cyanobacterium MAG.088]|nr:S-layer family protein [Leptolyngbyaceae cyanobacterium MAG.088]
ITINAGDVLLTNTFLGTTTLSSGFISGKGNGGDLEINANNLTLTEGAFIGSFVEEFGFGDAGNVTLNIQDSIFLEDQAQIISSSVFNSVGDSGRIQINTGDLSLVDGSIIISSVFGDGDAGSIIVDARDSITIDGAAGEFLPSAIASDVFTDATGQGGIINLTTAVLTVTNGGTITASTDGDGNAGSVTINATESATFDGIGPFDRVSSVGVIADENTTGVAGTLTVETPFLQVLNGAEITAETLGGTGTGGNLIIRADELRLENQASLTAETVNTDGGNITLDVGPLLLLRNGSEITATAGENANFGNGGNIAINMPDGFIVAVLDEDSNIEANAFLGDGGNVNIVAQGLFGIEFQENSTLQSDITASSDFGLQGSVTIETPDVDPSKDLATLPTDLVDASRLVAQGCGDRDIATSLGEFTITGRGGLPPTPEQLTAQTSLAEWETLDTPEQVQSSAQPIDSELESRTIQQIEEFQGWIVNDRGDVVLTADADTAIPRSPWQPAVQCRTQS